MAGMTAVTPSQYSIAVRVWSMIRSLRGFAVVVTVS